MPPRYKKLFVHGWATDSQVWKGLAGEGDITVDLPSHGTGAEWKTPDLNPAVLAIKESLGTLPDGEKVVGVGWSLGAKALMHFAATDPKRFHALVLIGASPSFTARDNFPHGRSRALVRRMLMDLKKAPAETLKRFYRLNFTGEELESPERKAFLKLYERTPSGFDIDGITTALQCLLDIDIREEIKKIKTPILLIHGELDEICPVAAAEYLKEHIKNATLVRMPKAGHAPFIIGPQRVRTMIEEFLEKHGNTSETT